MGSSRRSCASSSMQHCCHRHERGSHLKGATRFAFLLASAATFLGTVAGASGINVSASAAAAASSSTLYFSWANTGGILPSVIPSVASPAAGLELQGTASSSPPIQRSGDGGAPVFITQPERIYYLRPSTSARQSLVTLTCRANAFDVDVICVKELVQPSVTRHQDPLFPGRTIVTARVNISYTMVAGYFGEYRCECIAYLDLARTRKVSSSSAVVGLARMNKNFGREPLSTAVEFLQQAELQCLPPEGIPPLTVSWQKNGEEIVKSLNTNYIVTHDGSLIINQARPNDEGNYTCIARNELGMQRQTDPAILTVNVNGAWSPWSSWTRCDNPCVASGGQQQQHRQRECKNPQPRNGGRPCEGPPAQSLPCSHSCTASGQWGIWSSWSVCKADCQRYRTRTCISDGSAAQPIDAAIAAAIISSGGHSGCDGLDLENANCTEPCQHEDLGTSGAGEDKEALENIILYVSLCGAVAIFAVILIVIVLCVMKKLSHRNASHSHAVVAVSRADSYSPGGISEKTHLSSSGGSNRPDLTKTIQMEHARRHVYQEPSASTTERVPMLPRSERGGYYYASNVCGLISAPSALPPPLPPPMLPRRESHGDSSDDCASSCGRASSSGVCNSYDHCSTASERLLSNVDAEALCWTDMTHAGGRLEVVDSGISLMIPEGALAKGSHEEAFIACLREDKDRPNLLDKQTLLSPVLLCGPQNAPLQRTPVLTFDHCANLKSGQWKLALYSSRSPYDDDSPVWERLLTLNQEQAAAPPVYCHLDAGRCHVMLNQLASRYCLVGESAYGGRALKQLKLVAFSKLLPPPQSSASRTAAFEHSIRIYVLPDTRDALQSVTHIEAKYGAKMVDKPKQLPFQDGGSSLCIAMESLAPGWTSKLATNCQEIPFMHVWSGSQNYLHCSFAFETAEPVQRQLTCKMQVYQKSVPQGRQTLTVVCESETLSSKNQNRAEHASAVTVGTVSAAGSSSGCSSIVTLDGLQGRHQQRSAFRLSSRLRSQLSALLDPPQRRCADWRILCTALGAERQLNFFACRPSPTEAVLNLWEALRSEDTPMSDLTNILRSIGREDAASIVDRESGGNGWV